MTREEIFDVWAPTSVVWSAWVKPVVFAHIDESVPTPSPVTFPVGLDWKPEPSPQTVLVVDLPGALGVQVGMEMARLGFRPVPLYNAAPSPTFRGPMPEGVAMVDVWPIIRAVVDVTGMLAELKLAGDAPPVFLLDSNRRNGIAAVEGQFDNRSISFPTDFPSANFLLSRGMKNVVVIQQFGGQPDADLAHTLKRWQNSGISILVKATKVPGPPEPCAILDPPLFGSLWHRAMVALGLRRNPLGGFGGFVPEPSSG